VLVSDITYIPTREGWLYLAVVIDLFSRAILGWKLSDSLHAALVVDAATRAIDSGLCPGVQSFTPIAVANIPPLSPASCLPDMACAKA
jgi:transposase InsO family protein